MQDKDFLPPTSSASFTNEFVQLILNFQDYAIFMLNPDGAVMRWNPGAEHLYGYNADEIIGQNFSLFFTADEVNGNVASARLEKALASGRLETEDRIARKDGLIFYGNTIITPVRNSQGLLGGFAVVTRDITKEKQLEEENKILHDNLEEKVRQRTEELSIVNKELEAFSYSVSHDLRTPLRAISGFSNMLQEDYENRLDAEGKRIINVIVDNTKKMGALIDDLLTFSRMSRLEIVYEAINMKRLANACVTELVMPDDPTHYQIKVGDLPTCKGDPNMLKQVWLNLIGNAVKYSAKTKSPKIEISGSEEDQYVVYSIKDNGVGFDMQYYDKLFGVFQRLHREDEFEGTGLGLALVKRIITKHLGQIWGEAEQDNGATFYFRLPK